MSAYAWQRLRQSGLRRVLRNLWLDFRYGRRLLGGVVESEHKDKGYWNTENSDYDVLDRVFRQAALTEWDVVVDVGCGRGRPMNYLLHRKLTNPLVGIEINPEVAGFTRKRLQKFPQVSIVTGDIRESLPADGTVFYLANPFSDETVEWFAEAMAKRKHTGRPLILYYNPRSLEPFEKRGWKITPIDVSDLALAKAVMITPC